MPIINYQLMMTIHHHQLECISYTFGVYMQPSSFNHWLKDLHRITSEVARFCVGQICTSGDIHLQNKSCLFPVSIIASSGQKQKVFSLFIYLGLQDLHYKPVVNALCVSVLGFSVWLVWCFLFVSFFLFVVVLFCGSGVYFNNWIVVNIYYLEDIFYSSFCGTGRWEQQR